MSDTAENETQLQLYRDEWLAACHEIERLSLELQRSRADLIKRTQELQQERESKTRQAQEQRGELKKVASNLNDSRLFFEVQTRELQETIDKLMESEAQLSAARRTLDKAAEGERKRIADGLHSGPVHKLSEALLEIDELLSKSPELASALEKIRAELEAALSLTDQAVHQLKPVELKRGLVEGLRALLQRSFPDRQQARFNGRKEDAKFGLDEESQIHIYRFALEALNNVQRHGKNSTKVELSIEEKNGYLILSISNEMPEPLNEASATVKMKELEEGHGIHNMQAYATLLNASMEKSSTSSSFCVRLHKRI